MIFGIRTQTAGASTASRKPDPGQLSKEGRILPAFLALFFRPTKAQSGRALPTTHKPARAQISADVTFWAKVKDRQGITTFQVLLPGNTTADSLFARAALALELQHDLIAPTVAEVSRRRPGNSPALCHRDQLLTQYRNRTRNGTQHDPASQTAL